MSDDVLSRLASTVAARASADAGQSYTRALLDRGVPYCARKFGEEAVEAVVAVLGTDDAAVASEAADLLYHFLVMLEARGIKLDTVLDELKARESQSGFAEKASRVTPAQ